MTARPCRTLDERGTATAFVVGMAITLLAVAGLVLDGGNALNARGRLADDVEQAARAGANELSEASLRGEQVIAVDEAAASARARSYLLDRGYRVDAVSVTANTVTIGGSDTVATQLLNLIGVADFDVSATATAEAVTE